MAGGVHGVGVFYDFCVLYMLCAELLSGSWSVFGGWSQIFVPQA